MKDNVIPPMTHPLSRHWKQPKPDGILVDDTHAVMNAKCFEALSEYSYTCPTCVYDGKMWKAREEGDGDWCLCWYGPSEFADRCSINVRKLLVA